MNNENKYTLVATSGGLISVGFTKLSEDLNIGLGLIASGVILQILVAVLQKFGVPVSARIDG